MASELAIEAAHAALQRARDQEQREYWAFTRTARGRPVRPETMRAVIAAEDRLFVLLREDK